MPESQSQEIGGGDTQYFLSFPCVVKLFKWEKLFARAFWNVVEKSPIWSIFASFLCFTKIYTTCSTGLEHEQIRFYLCMHETH